MNTSPGLLPARAAVAVFLAFAFAYFFSALLRAVTATLAPALTAEFTLNARDLGLLAGGYFLGFAATQLPLGTWLDRHGPKKVIIAFLAVAVLGCIAFAAATSFSWLLVARILCGAGVSACLMAPLTGFRRWFDPAIQLRANAWMLMTGSFGMLASTLPVQWLMPLVGWRPLFLALAVLIALSMAVIAWKVPAWQAAPVDASAVPSPGVASGYAGVWRHPYFLKVAPVGFFSYGGMIAMQTLWAGPWMVRVAGYAPLDAATGLFFINLSMLVTFWGWGMVSPALTRRGITTDRLITWGLPSSFVVMGAIIAAGSHAGAAAWALFCVSSTFMSLAQPAVGMAFPAALAGRALSAYNLVIFGGVFVVQWGIGLLIDAFAALGLGATASFQCALGVFLACSIASYAWFLAAKSHNPQSSTP
ncbi:MAG: MFS transporter [Burkholderiaceae bacterium]